MKEALNEIWNMPKEKFDGILITMICVFALAVLIKIIIGVIAYRNFRKREKEFDDKFKNFGGGIFKDH